MLCCCCQPARASDLAQTSPIPNQCAAPHLEHKEGAGEEASGSDGKEAGVVQHQQPAGPGHRPQRALNGLQYEVAVQDSKCALVPAQQAAVQGGGGGGRGGEPLWGLPAAN